MSNAGNVTFIIKNTLNDSIVNDDADENATADHEASVNFSQHNLTAIIVLSLIYGLLSLTACIGNLLVIWIIGKCVFVFYLERKCILLYKIWNIIIKPTI